jgi:TetR/AcrR family transcriptional regulator
MITNSNQSTEPPPAARRRRRGSDIVASELLDAALHEFAAHGFEGATTRAIAERAGAHQPQINYHFESKEQLWHAAIDRLFALLQASVDTGETADPVERFTVAVRQFISFSAARPELHRIMDLESTASSARLDWIVERHAGPMFAFVSEGWAEVRAAGAGNELAPIDVWLLLVGVGALPFANAPVLQRFGGPDPADTEQVQAHAAWVLTLLGLGDSASSPPRRRTT